MHLLYMMFMVKLILKGYNDEGHLLNSGNELGIILPIVVKPTENLFHPATLKLKLGLNQTLNLNNLYISRYE